MYYQLIVKIKSKEKEKPEEADREHSVKNNILITICAAEEKAAEWRLS